MCWLYQAAQLRAFPHIVLVALLLVGLIECFAGYRAWRFLIGFNGAILGLFAGPMLAIVAPHPAVLVLGALVGAVAGAVLCASLQELGTFVFAMTSAASLAAIVVLAVHLPMHVAVSIAGIAGLATGLLALAAGRPVVLVLTAACGAEQAVSAGMAWMAAHGYWEPPIMDTIEPGMLAGFIALATTGCAVQWLTARAWGHARADSRSAMMPPTAGDPALH